MENGEHYQKKPNDPLLCAGKRLLKSSNHLTNHRKIELIKAHFLYPKLSP